MPQGVEPRNQFLKKDGSQMDVPKGVEPNLVIVEEGAAFNNLQMPEGVEPNLLFVEDAAAFNNL